MERPTDRSKICSACHRFLRKDGDFSNITLIINGSDARYIGKKEGFAS
jgi:hypothetical protein